MSNAIATAAIRTTKKNSRTNVRRLLRAIWSYRRTSSVRRAPRSQRGRQNSTLTGPVASGSPSKYSRFSKLNIPAMTVRGNVWILLLYESTESL